MVAGMEAVQRPGREVEGDEENLENMCFLGILISNQSNLRQFVSFTYVYIYIDLLQSLEDSYVLSYNRGTFYTCDAARCPRNGSMIPAMGMNFVANWTTN